MAFLSRKNKVFLAKQDHQIDSQFTTSTKLAGRVHFSNLVGGRNITASAGEWWTESRAVSISFNGIFNRGTANFLGTRTPFTRHFYHSWIIHGLFCLQWRGPNSGKSCEKRKVVKHFFPLLGRPEREQKKIWEAVRIVPREVKAIQKRYGGKVSPRRSAIKLWCVHRPNPRAPRDSSVFFMSLVDNPSSRLRRPTLQEIRVEKSSHITATQNFPGSLQEPKKKEFERVSGRSGGKVSAKIWEETRVHNRLPRPEGLSASLSDILKAIFEDFSLFLKSLGRRRTRAWSPDEDLNVVGWKMRRR